MNVRIRIISALLAVLAAGSAGAADFCSGSNSDALVSAATNQATGHYFEVYRADGISWGDASAHLAGRSCGGVAGHLATITSAAEEAFVDPFRHNALGTGLVQPQVWVGGYTDANGWHWVNNEGPFPASNSGPQYTHWADGEPNNVGGSESHLSLGRYDGERCTGDCGWNDEGSAPASIGGYIVEYDVPRAAACSGTSCQTIDGQTLVFPAGSIPPGATIGFNAYEFTDPRVDANGRCNGNTPLTLFGAAYSKPELRIPAYLCGSPKFVVVAVDSSQLSINSGTVYVENFTNVVLPGNQYRCEDPIVQNFPAQGDPQFQDVVVWQSTDPTLMRENSSGAGLPFAGAAGEFTSFCGSSGAKVKGASYFVVGLHIDFGSAYDWAYNKHANHLRFVDLTLYKLALLRQSVTDAYAAGAIRKLDAALMTGLVDAAVKALQLGKERAALLSVKLFLALVNVTQYRTVANQNYNGEHVMRGTNIEFMLRVKVVPYGP
jgi:hypothetical protein